MKKIVLVAITLFAAFILQAQEAPKTDSLEIYAGKYKFPEGSVVSQTEVFVDNGNLFANSDMGKSTLKKTDVADVFEIVEYSGLATFKRNADGKIIGVKIEVGEIVLEGTKVEPTQLSANDNQKVINRNAWAVADTGSVK